MWRSNVLISYCGLAVEIAFVDAAGGENEDEEDPLKTILIDWNLTV